MSQEYLRMGHDNDLVKKAADATKDVIIVKQMHAGSKLFAKSDSAMANFDQKYRELFHEKYKFPMRYRSVEDPPSEGTTVKVMWGDILAQKEFGSASRLGNDWYYKNRRNTWENGNLCAIPTAWKN